MPVNFQSFNFTDMKRRWLVCFRKNRSKGICKDSCHPRARVRRGAHMIGRGRRTQPDPPCSSAEKKEGGGRTNSPTELRCCCCCYCCRSHCCSRRTIQRALCTKTWSEMGARYPTVSGWMEKKVAEVEGEGARKTWDAGRSGCERSKLFHSDDAVAIIVILSSQVLITITFLYNSNFISEILESLVNLKHLWEIIKNKGMIFSKLMKTYFQYKCILV